MRVTRLGLALLFVCLSPLAAAGSVTPMFVCDSANHLLKVDVLTGQAELVGQSPVRFTDIAFGPGGRLYGVTSNYLYEIDPRSGESALIGPHGYGQGGRDFGIDALAFAGGVLYAAGNDILIAIDPETAATTTVGTLSGYRSAGDLAVDAAGRLLLTTDAADLVEVHLDGSGATLIGSLGYHDVFALSAGPDGTLYGLRSTNEIVSVDPGTGRATIVGSLHADFPLGHAWGGSFPTSHFPEPTTGLLCLCGVVCLRWRRRRR